MSSQLEDLLNKINDIRKQVEELARLDVAPLPSSIATYSGTPVAGQLAQWTGAGTITNSGYAGSAVTQYTGVPSAGQVMQWSGPGTATQAGYAGSAVTRYTGVPTAGAVSYWTGNGTVAHASFGTADVVTLAGTQTLTNKTLTTPTLTTPVLTLRQSMTPAPTAEGDLQWDTNDDQIVVGDGSGQKIFSDDSKQMLLAGAQTAAGVKDFTNGIKVANGTTLTHFSSGTWTITLRFGGATTGITYGTQTGTYLRINNRVWLHGTIILTSKGSATGAADISGLPFTVATTTVAATRWRAMNTSYIYLTVVPLTGTTTMTFRATTAAAAGVETTLADTNFTNTSTITFEATYEV